MNQKSTIEFPHPSQSSTKAQDPVDELKGRTVVGPSTSIRGEISGQGAVTVHGQVEGRIELMNHNVTVGKKGRVKADILAKIISIEGHVRGNLYGEDKIIIRETGNVRGDIMAPRVNLEDGSKFKGKIEMDSSTPRRPPWLRQTARRAASPVRVKESEKPS